MPLDDELQRYLRDASIKVKRKLATAIKAEADKLADAIRTAAPVATGKLRDSVKVRRRKNDLDLVVSAGGEDTTTDIRAGSGKPYDYALAVEFGTRKRPAQPFFYNTARVMQDEITENIQAAVAEALK
ncbi:MAG: phage protein gp10 family [Tardiphaga sp.]|nr:phage protein gp10 family [Tardiphaga sp.]